MKCRRQVRPTPFESAQCVEQHISVWFLPELPLEVNTCTQQCCALEPVRIELTTTAKHTFTHDMHITHVHVVLHTFFHTLLQWLGQGVVHTGYFTTHWFGHAPVHRDISFIIPYRVPLCASGSAPKRTCTRIPMITPLTPSDLGRRKQLAKCYGWYGTKRVQGDAFPQKSSSFASHPVWLWAHFVIKLAEWTYWVSESQCMALLKYTTGSCGRLRGHRGVHAPLREMRM